MRASSWFTNDEREDIDSFLPEMRRLKRKRPLSDLIDDRETKYPMTVAAELRLRVCRLLVERHTHVYKNREDPKTFFRYVTLDSVCDCVTLLRVRVS